MPTALPQLGEAQRSSLQDAPTSPPRRRRVSAMAVFQPVAFRWMPVSNDRPSRRSGADTCFTATRSAASSCAQQNNDRLRRFIATGHVAFRTANCDGDVPAVVDTSERPEIPFVAD